ncbi:accessory Sec system protein Asp1 [Lactococcus lactis]|uniref:accessory Sec system protein Asp1 n=1 Tax=Lactococcus lactis TaxID=1358 RepID=UPI0024159AC2|nr:accessory Sec system protein Asp1 [Lactococcus lactis]MDG4969782.1 accessory Sec system protein Asp1 [Lactococcus lactis]MDG5103688.1 accessory Sec system protein Asp1 [Lactococcus lactis]
MIIFVPSWKDTASIDGGTDDLIGPIRSFILSEEKYQILVSDYVPNLRYFLHRFDLLESNYFSIFDELQGFYGMEQKAVDFKNINFPCEVIFTYTPRMILAFQNNVLVGKILLGEGSQVSEVHHFRESQLQMIDIYDDRGFISSQKFYRNNALEYTSYLDSAGEEIFVQFAWRGDCVVNLKNNHGLKHEYYDSIEQIQFECIESKLSDQRSQQLVVTATNDNLEYINNLCWKHQIILSVSQTHLKKTYEYNSRFKDIVTNLKNIFVDSSRQFDDFIELGIPKDKLRKTSSFDTRLTLSITQELKEEIVLLDIRRLNQSEYSDVLISIISYFEKERIAEETSRKFKLIIRTLPQDKQVILEYIDVIFLNKFPKEMSKIQVGEARNIDNIVLKKSLSKIDIVQELRTSIVVRDMNSEEELLKTIHQTRLVIDLAEEPDLFTQIVAISAGIPQINSTASDYVTHKENGWILADWSELIHGLDYYLSNLSHWQQARTFSIDKIKKYSGYNLCKSILEVFLRGE